MATKILKDSLPSKDAACLQISGLEKEMTSNYLNTSCTKSLQTIILTGLGGEEGVREVNRREGVLKSQQKTRWS